MYQVVVSEIVPYFNLVAYISYHSKNMCNRPKGTVKTCVIDRRAYNVEGGGLGQLMSI